MQARSPLLTRLGGGNAAHALWIPVIIPSKGEKHVLRPPLPLNVVAGKKHFGTSSSNWRRADGAWATLAWPRSRRDSIAAHYQFWWRCTHFI